MRRNRKLFLMIIAAIVMINIITLVGCGKEVNTSKTSNTKEGKANGNIKEGGSIVLTTSEPDFLDPDLATAADTRSILFNVFEGLVKPDENGNLIDAVASSHEISKDGLKYTFKLRKGIRFHNNKPVTVQDVKYSLDRAAGKDTGKPLKTELVNIKSVDIKDSSTIEVNLTAPDTDFLPYLTVAIIPKGYKNQNSKPIGTGPFKLVEYDKQQKIELAKNKDYWQKGLPHLDKVTYKIEDANALFLGLKAGNIDSGFITKEQADQLKTSYNTLIGSANLLQLLALNNSKKPFNDVRVRQALYYAIDTKSIIDTVADGVGKRAGTNFLSSFKKYYKAGLEKTYTQNINKAKKLLAEAGYPNGFETTITVPSVYQFHVDTAQIIVEQLKAINVKASIKKVEWGEWLEKTYKGRQYDSTVVSLDAAYLSPRALLGRYVSTDASNFLNYKNNNYDELYRKAVNEIDDNKKVEDYKELQEILNQDAASIYIQDQQKVVVLKKGLAGYKFYPTYVQDLASMYYTN
ncbi:ABC transporter substrate-binding protein [Clostridium guangxiense]|uniref:ABC transporter substrate-binding protein n=1 Tax=Clostridium guangxiense TaxID=1662055 RepID=UPI001E31ECAD|nr:ABC transporter substrate-binding protein [Clostridium guangxiense]MCD2347051.1 ABC transporter substrate-binding protein [Clostridium guangxiense]